MGNANLRGQGYTVVTDGDAYDSIEGTINNGVTNSPVTLTNVVTGNGISIDNDNTTAGHDFTVKFEATGNPARTVKAAETLTLNNFIFTKVYLTNASGNNIDYRIFIMGNSA